MNCAHTDLTLSWRTAEVLDATVMRRDLVLVLEDPARAWWMQKIVKRILFLLENG